MDTFFLIYVEATTEVNTITKTYGPYLSFSEACSVMLEYTELLLETENIYCSKPYQACVMEVLPREGGWIDIGIRAKDIPNINGTRYYEELT
jgi:hypothetical protein